MIPINFKELNDKDRLYHSLLNVKSNQRKKTEYVKKIRGINDWCLNNIVVKGRKYSFPDIIKADYEEIVKIAKVYQASKNKLSDSKKKFIIDTLYKQRFPRVEFVEALQVTVCPYCNRNFVNSTYKRTLCDLDHFYDKEKYPLLAGSFYSCLSCL